MPWPSSQRRPSCALQSLRPQQSSASGSRVLRALRPFPNKLNTTNKQQKIKKQVAKKTLTEAAKAYNPALGAAVEKALDTKKGDEYLDEFDTKVGLNRIKCVHINDSKNILGSHKDRHENIGYGTIGFDNLINVIYNPRLDNIPKILETPYIDKEYPPYKFEIEMIRNKEFNEHLYDNVIKYYKEG